MIKLSVNVNKVATIRNSRGGTVPSVLEAAGVAVDAGAARHHRAPACRRPPHHRFATSRRWPTCWRRCAAASSSTSRAIRGPTCWRWCVASRPTSARWCPWRPARSRVRPDGRPTRRATSFARWSPTCKAHGIRVSLFVDAERGGDRVGRRAWAATASSSTPSRSRRPFAQGDRPRRPPASTASRDAARRAHDRGLGVNAGHDLDLDNLVAVPHAPAPGRGLDRPRDRQPRAVCRPRRAPCASTSPCCRGRGVSRRLALAIAVAAVPRRGRALEAAETDRASRVGRHGAVGSRGMRRRARRQPWCSCTCSPAASRVGSDARGAQRLGLRRAGLDLRGHGASGGSSSALAPMQQDVQAGPRLAEDPAGRRRRPARHRRRVAGRRRWRRWWPPPTRRCVRLRCCRRRLRVSRRPVRGRDAPVRRTGGRDDAGRLDRRSRTRCAPRITSNRWAPGSRDLRVVDGTNAHGTTLLTARPELVASLVDWFRRSLL